MMLLALDPGGTTGWALFEAGVPLRWGQAKEWDPWDALLQHGVDVVVYERFALYASKVADLVQDEVIAAQRIGVIRYLAGRLIPPPLIVVQPALCIHYTPAGRATPTLPPILKALVDAVCPTGPHQRDALAHGFYALRYNVKVKELHINGTRH